MQCLTEIVLKGISALLVLFNNACKPDSRYFKDQLQLEFTHHRNKAFVLFHLSAFSLYIIQAIFMSVPIMKSTMGIITCTTVIILIVLAPKYNPQVLKTAYNIIIALFGPLIMLHFDGGIHRAWMGVQLYPTVVLFCTGSVWHYLFQTGLQMIFMQTIYQAKMIQTINFMSPEELIKSLTQASTTYSFINILIILCIYATLQNAYARIMIAEKKKTEMENQKIFLLSFSHELRNLINSLMGNVRLASLETLTGKAQTFLRNADVCGELLLHLINNILDTGKVEVGELEINPSPTNIYQTMEKIWSICSELIRGKNLLGKLKIRNNLPKFLQVDSYRLTQILLNLIGNAVKFTDSGSINIIIEWTGDTPEVNKKCFEPYPFDDENDLSEGIFEKNQMFSNLDPNLLELTLSQPFLDQSKVQQQSGSIVPSKGLLKITVHDTGPGMSKEDISKLFQKFTQVSSDSSKRKLGTGLGLFITKQLCEKMDGQIRVFSKKDKGSCFVICIPLTPVLGPSSYRSEQISYHSFSQNSIGELKTMIVDDEPFSQMILRNFFSKLQMEVSEVAKNGLEAYRHYVDYAARGEPISVVTMDLTMPIMSGKEAAMRIRQFEEENGIRSCLLIVISGNCTESEIRDCTDPNGRIRANAFIKKPAKVEEISRVLLSFLRMSSREEIHRNLIS